MHNPQPSTSVSPPVCAGLNLILKENVVVLHEKEKKCIAHLPRQKFKNCCMFESYLSLTSGVGEEGIHFCICVSLSPSAKWGRNRVVALSGAIYKAF